MDLDHVSILTIGDEILSGRVTDTNSGFIATKLRSIGIDTVLHMSCADDVEHISKSLAFCHQFSNIVITSGGLGPTDDDLTHKSVAEYFGLELELNESELERIKERFKYLNFKMSKNNERQAELPIGSDPIPNPQGTACGCVTEKDGKVVISVPGVPRELYTMIEDHVEPYLRDRFNVKGFAKIRVLKTYGFTESKLGEIISKIPLPHESVRVGYRPSFPEIHLSIAAFAEKESEAQAWIDEYEKKVRETISYHVWGVDDDQYSGVIGDILRDHGYRMASAESCTGGLISKMMTDVSGSSDYFERGFATYTNEAKQQMIGVSADIFEPNGPGAVSERCAIEMAQGAQKAAGVEIAVSTTGIAGPGGGSPEKPVGTVWIGLATQDGVSAQCFRFPGTREWVRTLSAYTALERLRRHLLGLPTIEKMKFRCKEG